MPPKTGTLDVKPKVCVVGLGYIGLPTAAIIARAGCPVLGLDVTQSVVDTINRGEIHIEEVDLDGLVQGVVQRGLLRAASALAGAATASAAAVASITSCTWADRRLRRM